MHFWKARRDLSGTDRVSGFEWPHRDDQWSGERLGRLARHVRSIHRHIATLLDMTNAKPRRHQGLLERKRASENESDQIVAPVRDNVGRLLDEIAVTPNAIARQVGTDVEIGTERRYPWIADVGNADQWARPAVEVTEALECRGELLGQDDEIALQGSRRDIRGRPGPLARAAGETRLTTV